MCDDNLFVSVVDKKTGQDQLKKLLGLSHFC